MRATCDLQKIAAEVARGANARPGRARQNKEGPPTRASLATPFQDTADGFEVAGGSGRTGHGGFESHSFCTRRVELLTPIDPNPEVRKSGEVAKAVLASMVLEEDSIRAARGDLFKRYPKS